VVDGATRRRRDPQGGQQLTAPSISTPSCPRTARHCTRASRRRRRPPHRAQFEDGDVCPSAKPAIIPGKCENTAHTAPTTRIRRRQSRFVRRTLIDGSLRPLVALAKPLAQSRLRLQQAKSSERTPPTEILLKIEHQQRDSSQSSSLPRGLSTRSSPRHQDNWRSGNLRSEGGLPPRRLSRRAAQRCVRLFQSSACGALTRQRPAS